MLAGILNINKPKNITSHDVVNQLRRILKIKKIGHAGTLDPAATGVLPLCIGKVTRLIQYLPTDKQYIAEITLGITTDSYDSDGEITSKQDVNLNEKQLLEALETFKGTITQEVPLASATHYKGKKLYKYAHKGIEIKDLPTKTVTIYDIQLIEITKKETTTPVIKLKIDCSTGTYIRSIANDLGKKLETGAFLSSLIRTQSCNLLIEDSISIEDLKITNENNDLHSVLISPTKLINWPQLQLNLEQREKISQGQYFKLLEAQLDDNQKVFLLNDENSIVGVGNYSIKDEIIKPEIVFIQ